MCQTSKTADFIRLEEPMTVYKIMIKGGPPRIVYSSFLRSEYMIGKMYGMPLSVIQNGIDMDGNNYGITEGIHSFIHLEDAIKENISRQHRVYESIIPKGAFVLRGKWSGGNGMETIVSDKVIVRKLIFSIKKVKEEKKIPVTVTQLKTWLKENGYPEAAVEIQKMQRDKVYRKKTQFGIWQRKWGSMKTKRYSLRNLLISLFDWRGTLQGQEYWDNIHSRLYF